MHHMHANGKTALSAAKTVTTKFTVLHVSFV